jgi:hypothetical protein
MVACFNFGPGMDAYFAGYRRAADVLIEHIATRGESQDLLVFPLMFSLRHALEIGFKELISAAQRLLETDHVAYEKTHNLTALWNVCSVLLRGVWPNDTEPFDSVSAVVTALVILDPTNEGFRYFHTVDRRDGRKGRGLRPTLDSELRQMDLTAAYGDVSHTLDLLDAAQMGLDQYLEWKVDAQSIRQEFEAAIRAEFEEPYQRDEEERYEGAVDPLNGPR